MSLNSPFTTAVPWNSGAGLETEMKRSPTVINELWVGLNFFSILLIKDRGMFVPVDNQGINIKHEATTHRDSRLSQQQQTTKYDKTAEYQDNNTMTHVNWPSLSKTEQSHLQ